MDFFSKEGPESSWPFEKVGIRSGTYIEIYKAADPDPKGCHTFQADEGQFKKREQIWSEIEGLKNQADEWAFLKKEFGCDGNICIHNYPTRQPDGTHAQEMKVYNAVKTGKLDSSQFVCDRSNDYRLNYEQ